ncbi:hypothetical protein DSECCO2_05140 [anaerobic digester metagenome]
MTVKEYRRTCKQCNTVWHSLVKRESNLKWYACSQGIATGFSPSHLCTCGMCSGAERAQREKNVYDERSEIERLKSCPNCGSKNYNEEIIEYDK